MKDLNVLAKEISMAYAANQKVEAVLLAGSVSRKWEDEYSDIELHVLWKDAPSDEDRLGLIKAVKGELIDFHGYEDEEWSETYWCEGVKIEISSFLTETIVQKMEEVIDQYDTDLDKQCLVASIQSGTALSGARLIEELKGKAVHYPHQLKENMIMDHLDLGSRWGNREALLHREDWLMLYKVMVSVQSNLMGIFFGLNEIYVHHPSFKWQKNSLKRMNTVPENIAERMSQVWLRHPKEGLLELEALVRDTFSLLEKEMPQLSISKYKEKSSFLRSLSSEETP